MDILISIITDSKNPGYARFIVSINELSTNPVGLHFDIAGQYVPNIPATYISRAELN